MAHPSPYKLTAADDYRGRIELAAGVTISLRHFENDPDFGTEWWGTAARDTNHDYAGGMTTRTVASATAFSEIAVLDRIAKQLGVFERINREAITARVAVGAVNLAEAVV